MFEFCLEFQPFLVASLVHEMPFFALFSSASASDLPIFVKTCLVVVLAFFLEQFLVRAVSSSSSFTTESELLIVCVD